VDFIGIAARYYGELAAKYTTGQACHSLLEPLKGEWYVLLYLGMIYIDVQPHPLATQERRLFGSPYSSAGCGGAKNAGKVVVADPPRE
jgi:hypothetical protein